MLKNSVDEMNMEWSFFNTVETVWKYKKILIVVALSCGVLFGALGTFLIKPIYEVEMNVVINPPETVNTKYGPYKLEKNTGETIVRFLDEVAVLNKTLQDMEYKKKTDVRSLRKKINITKENTLNPVVKVVAPSAVEARNIALNLFKNFKFQAEVLEKEGATEFFLSKFQADILYGEGYLKELEAILDQSTIRLKEAEEIMRKSAGRDNIQYGSLDYIALGNAMGFAQMGEEVAKIKNDITRTKESLVKTKKYVTALEEEKKNIAKYYEGKSEYKVEDPGFRIVAPYIHMAYNQLPVVEKRGPGTGIHILAGMMLGFVGCVAGIFVKEAYHTWKQVETRA